MEWVKGHEKLAIQKLMQSIGYQIVESDSKPSIAPQEQKHHSFPDTGPRTSKSRCGISK